MRFDLLKNKIEHKNKNKTRTNIFIFYLFIYLFIEAVMSHSDTDAPLHFATVVQGSLYFLFFCSKGAYTYLSTVAYIFFHFAVLAICSLSRTPGSLAYRLA